MGRIAIVGLREDEERLPEPALERVRLAKSVVVPSAEGAAALFVAREHITPVTFDELGMAGGSAQDVASALQRLSAEGDVALVTSGLPFASGVVASLLDTEGAEVSVLPAASPFAVLLLTLARRLGEGVEIREAHDVGSWQPKRGRGLFVTGVANQLLAHGVAERVAEVFSAGHRVVAADGLGAAGFTLAAVRADELAALPAVSPDRAVYVEPLPGEDASGFDELVRIMQRLRNPEGGCPWDLEQTHMSIRSNMIEEAYEAVAAIEEHDDAHLAEELGDILLQVVFHAQMAAEEGSFTIDDATRSITEKLRRRHPHIFGEAQAGSAGEVLHQWERIKRSEKPQESVLASVPHALPALLRAQKISRKAAATGFDWETVEDVWAKVHEEIEELKATQPGTQEAADEVGDVLFSVVNVARKLGVDAETALRVTCDRFSKRFAHMEAAAAQAGTNLADLDTGSMEELWQEAKRAERSQAPLE